MLLFLFLIFKYSYFSGLENSLKVSKYKYKIAGWLQEMARNNYSFRRELNYDFALQKNDTFVLEYLNYRESLFDIIKRQFSQLIVFKIIVTASLLSIGGYLVIVQEMNIGQFVAAEIIILLVINSVEKIIIGLETLYDVLTAVEKIGLITDLSMEDDSPDDTEKYFSAISLQAENLGVKFPNSPSKILKNINLKIEQGERLLIEGENGSGKTTLIRILSTLLQPSEGSLYINDDTFSKINFKQYRSQIGNIIHGETPFEGTILDNITFKNSNISNQDMKWAIEGVQLSEYIKSLPNSLETQIFPEGKQLSSSNAQKILLARSIVNKPRILFYEDPTDAMDEKVANEIIDFISSEQNKWTIIISSKNPYWKTKCSRILTMHKGQIISDTQK
jgi:ABC-type bacteriocin/lantibiotic exporter with double-glycine peptidase domain